MPSSANSPCLQTNAPLAPARAAPLSQIFQMNPAPMLITDPHGVICDANKAMEQACGYSLAELRGQRPSLMRSQRQSAEFYRRLWAGLLTTRRWHGEIWNRHKDGREYREWLRITALEDGQGRVSHYLGLYAGFDHGGAVAAEPPADEAIDPITGVLTRQAFIVAANRLGVPGQHVAVLTLDLDGFTDLNEQFGLRAGDQLLRQVALRCTQVAAASGGEQLVGRAGADEFAVAWLPDAADPDKLAQAFQVHTLAQRLHAAVTDTYDLGVGRHVAVAAQIGVALATVGQHGAAEALQHASAARHDVQVGASAVRNYEAHDGLRHRTRALRQALHEDQIDIALQPKVDLRSGALRGVEALARWTDNDGRVVPPSEFIPLAERKGLIAELGDRVMGKALAWSAQMQRLGHLVPVAVNFSAPQFHRRDLAVLLQQALQQHGLAPALVELELTESILLGDVDAALDSLSALSQLGLQLSIDDFGTGYSSLSYLCRFPVNRLKLDRSFIGPLCTDARTLALVSSVIGLAHQLGLRCVAEGIETPEQLALLRQLDCDEGQGYLLARPMSALQAEQVLQGDLPWSSLFNQSPPVLARRSADLSTISRR